MTHLRKLMLEELERRNYAASTTRAYLRAVAEFARHFHRSPDQLGPDHIRQYQAYLFRERKLEPNTVIQHLVLLCYKRSAPQNGQPGSWLRIWRAMAIRSVAMDAGLCRA